ncbi:predicted protein [Phaeodactylum tricornutum CCAP 1055/1]|uniref:Uncharacterized protein n=2 Tax=Phaeodactylum tricornutum TaxID=2850 RepID=B5Y481_PHATC|nr:predicted protein [Phaeodactylum tricornutum CCAP 1055/1]ACI65432.1 predicted protein [Phaeodactylum tricornutum CCAP 1055/1]|eukprot:XP_002185962.1 predicted protein [Phaeodactylum tricornutum CCAP 1055/1]
MQNTTLAEALGSGDKKEKVQKATQGIESKGDQHKFILSNRAFVELSFYLQAPKEISDNKEPHKPLFSGKANMEELLTKREPKHAMKIILELLKVWYDELSNLKGCGFMAFCTVWAY